MSHILSSATPDMLWPGIFQHHTNRYIFYTTAVHCSRPLALRALCNTPADTPHNSLRTVSRSRHCKPCATQTPGLVPVLSKTSLANSPGAVVGASIESIRTRQKIECICWLVGASRTRCSPKSHIHSTNYMIMKETAEVPVDPAGEKKPAESKHF